jgi:hypothetical protein
LPARVRWSTWASLGLRVGVSLSAAARSPGPCPIDSTARRRWAPSMRAPAHGLQRTERQWEREGNMGKREPLCCCTVDPKLQAWATRGQALRPQDVWKEGRDAPKGKSRESICRSCARGSWGSASTKGSRATANTLRTHRPSVTRRVSCSCNWGVEGPVEDSVVLPRSCEVREEEGE